MFDSDCKKEENKIVYYNNIIYEPSLIKYEEIIYIRDM